MFNSIVHNMAPKAKKLCWNCEGNVLIDQDTCRYCGVSLDVSPIPGTANQSHSPPPYKLISTPANQSIPAAPYSAPEKDISAKEEAIPEEELSQPSNLFQNTAIAVSSLMLGVVFSLFGIILFAFSDAQGIFTLSWHARYWFVYVLMALPLLYIGLRTTDSLNNQD